MSSQRGTLDGLRIDRGALPAKTRPVWLVPLMILLAAGVAAVAWTLTHSSAPVVEVAIARVQANGGAGNSRTLLNASGYVTPRREATVSSKVTGKVMEINVEEGMKVEAGQVLARLDSSNVEASLRLAESQLDRMRKLLQETEPSLEYARREFKRFSDLSSTKVVSDSDLRKTESEAKVLEARITRQTAEINVAESELAQWKQQMDDTIIRAPFAGIVTSKNAQPGEMISPMSVGGFTRTGICTIVDMSSLEIEVDVNESFINRVQAGQEVVATLDAYPEWKIPSKVIAIIPTADRQKATVKVRVGFNQLDSRILPQMGVKVAFQSGGAESPQASAGVAIPKAAVQRMGDRDVVWVVQNSKLERRAVNVAQTSGDECQIGAGLKNGEKVVINPAANLSEGMRVTEKTP